MVLDITIVSQENPELLTEFLKGQISPHFRYYQTRDVMTSLKNQPYTIVGQLSDTREPVAYGHIDYEDRYWLGVCVLENHKGKKYGLTIMINLLNWARHNIYAEKLWLSVDIDNYVAICLYKKLGFKVEHGDSKKIFMSYQIQATQLTVPNNTIFLPVSTGEAFDKLSILEIKLEKITDGRKLDVQRI